MKTKTVYKVVTPKDGKLLPGAYRHHHLRLEYIPGRKTEAPEGTRLLAFSSLSKAEIWRGSRKLEIWRAVGYDPLAISYLCSIESWNEASHRRKRFAKYWSRVNRVKNAVVKLVSVWRGAGMGAPYGTLACTAITLKKKVG